MIDDVNALPPVYHLPGFHEPASAISHLVGAVAFAYLSVFLLRRGRGDPARMVYLGVYCFSAVLLFSLSGVYHMLVRGDSAHRVMARLDHAAIFVLIAGTFTPAHGILFCGWLRWLPLILIWSAAIVGITLKSIFFEDMPERLGIGSYLVLGWFGAISGYVLCRRFGFAFIRPLLLGGIAYSVGGLLEFARWPRIIPGVVHSHEMMHLAVLIGALFHFTFVWRIAPMHPSRSGLPSLLNRNCSTSPVARQVE